MGSGSKGKTTDLVEEITFIKHPPKRILDSPLLQLPLLIQSPLVCFFWRWPEMAFDVNPVRAEMSVVREAATETDEEEQRAPRPRTLLL